MHEFTDFIFTEKLFIFTESFIISTFSQRKFRLCFRKGCKTGIP